MHFVYVWCTFFYHLTWASNPMDWYPPWIYIYKSKMTWRDTITFELPLKPGINHLKSDWSLWERMHSWVLGQVYLQWGVSRFSGAPGMLHASTFCLLGRKLIQSGMVPELVCIMKVIIPDCQTQHSRRLMATCAAVVFARVQRLRGKSWENKHFLHLYLLSRCLSFFIL